MKQPYEKLIDFHSHILPNMDDGTIYRMTGRWIATVGKDDTIYRR